MKPIRPIQQVTILGALLALPLLSAGAAKLCLTGPVTPESYTWNFKSETSGLFDDIRVRAYRVQDHAATLASFTGSLGEPSWQSHAGELTQVKAEVNAMGEELCRLHTIRRAADPWQQNAIDRMTPRIVAMAARTESMIGFVNGHPQNLLNPEYRRSALALYEQSKALRQIAGQGYEAADGGQSPDEEEVAVIARNYCGL